MRTIEGLEIDYLRNELNTLRKIQTENNTLLVNKIYEWMMSNEDMGMGEAAEAMNEAEQIVLSWEQDLKLNLLTLNK